MYNFLKTEKEVLEYWSKTSAFEKSNENKVDHFVFYDGPPFATGLPHYGHLLVGTIKDVVARYKTMTGYTVPRQWGWDCHGVPVESLVQKKMNLSRVDVVAQGMVEKFNQTCRDSVFTCVDQWRDVVSRTGRWVDFDNSYKTMDKNYMESVWWVFKQIYDQGRIYKAKKVMPYSCKLQTTLSNSEVSDSYRSVEDPYVIVKFKMLDGGPTVLVYTTTPWTLPANAGICLNPDTDYAYVEFKDEVFLVALNLAEKLFPNGKVLETHKGSYFEGFRYKSLFDDLSHPIVTDSYVSPNDGTGAVHLAPLFGEDDYRLGLKYKLCMWDHLDAEGKFHWKINDYEGLFCKDADVKIVQDLKQNGMVFKYGTVKHDYPFCDRTNTPLIYRAVDAWYLKLEDVRERMLKHNATINWIPSSIGSNRFANWLENARDWNISRNRLWGSCLPIWESNDGELVCFGSIAELEDFSGNEVDDLHKDHLDKLVFYKNGKLWKRVPEVLDCWFESGSMPFAQYHYPFENKELVEKNFPADFIVEGLDQTRGWFYTLLVISTLLFDKAPFKNVIVNGMILAEDGSKMSKSKGNFTDVNTLLDRYGADALRAYFCMSPSLYAEPMLFKDKDLVTVSRSLLMPLTNALDFYQLYSKIDGWNVGDCKPWFAQELGVPNVSAEKLGTWEPARSLDTWILFRLNEVVRKANNHLENYDLGKVLPEVSVFLEDLCNWYIRLSRKLFWESGVSETKSSAYNTLHHVLVTLSKLLAPFTPFISEHIYHELGHDGSVHWENFPEAEDIHPDEEGYVLSRMSMVRSVAASAHSLRVKNGIKVRQPLSEMTVYGKSLVDEEVLLLKEELNVKNIVWNEKTFVPNSVFTAKANFKSLGKRCGKSMQAVAAAIANLSNQKILELHDTPTNVLGFDVSINDVVLVQTVQSQLPLESTENFTVMLDTTLTPELVQEGDFREVCSFLQNLRKNNHLLLTDKITVYYSGPSNCFQNRLEELKNQVLAVDLVEKQLTSSDVLETSSGNITFEVQKV